MKTKAFLMCFSMGFAGLVASCTSESDEPGFASGKGVLALDIKSGVTFVEETRAVNENDYRNVDNYTVVITTDKGNEKFSGSYSTLKTRLPLELDNGVYTIQAYHGSEEAASRQGFRASDLQTFNVQSNPKNDPLEVTLRPSPSCGKASVNFVTGGEIGLDTYYDDYYVTISGTNALGTNSVTWAKTDTEPWYLLLDAAGEDVTYTIHLTAKEEYATKLDDGTETTSSVITRTFNLKRNKATKLTISANYTPTTEGGLKIIIDIDDTTNPEKVIPIPVPTSWM